MAKKPKISAEVGEAEMESFKQAAAAKGVTLSEWIRAKLNAPDAPVAATPSAPAIPVTEPAPPPPVVVLPLNPTPALIAATVSVADKRRMLFESPDKLPPYRPPERKEGPAAQPMVASHPVARAPNPQVAVSAPPSTSSNGRVEEAIRVSEHPCVHLRPGAPGNLRAGECFGTCNNSRQQGKPCFWAPASVRSCSLFNAKVAQIISVSQKTPVYPRR